MLLEDSASAWKSLDGRFGFTAGFRLISSFLWSQPSKPALDDVFRFFRGGSARKELAAASMSPCDRIKASSSTACSSSIG